MNDFKEELGYVLVCDDFVFWQDECFLFIFCYCDFSGCFRFCLLLRGKYFGWVEGGFDDCLF